VNGPPDSSATEFAFHALADLFPLMEGEDFAALVEDIRAQGLNEPIVIFENQLLEGRNRYRACREAGVTPKYVEKVFDSEAAAVAFVISANIHRRHLTAEQRRELTTKLLKANPQQSDRKIAAVVKVDHKTIAEVRRRAEGSGEIPQMVKRVDRKGRSRPAHTHRAVEPRAAKTTKAEGALNGSTFKASGEGEPAAEQSATKPVPRDDVGPYSKGEHDRLRARVDELNAEKRLLEIKIAGLQQEVEGLRADFEEDERIIDEFTQQDAGTVALVQPISVQFADGEWHSTETIAAKLASNEAQVDAALRVMQQSAGVKVECKGVGASFSYRLFKTVSTVELNKKLTPLFKGLMVERKKNRASIKVGGLALRLHGYLVEWLGRKPRVEDGNDPDLSWLVTPEDGQ
jgi:hypothetical protein